MDRWRKPVTTLNIEVSRTRSCRFVGDDRGLMEEYEVTLDPESVERIRLGHVCINCFEPQQSPFPDECALCGYAIKTDQANQFALTYTGVERIGPRISLADEALMAAEQASRIWTPGGRR